MLFLPSHWEHAAALARAGATGPGEPGTTERWNWEHQVAAAREAGLASWWTTAILTSVSILLGTLFYWAILMTASIHLRHISERTS